MNTVKVCILRSAGTNCDWETAYAFYKAGSEPEFVHINRLVEREKTLQGYEILALPGGFSYGDDAGAGSILANELRCKLTEDLRSFVRSGKLIIGICNGFQVLVKSGLLPGGGAFTRETSLIINDSGKFEDRWVYLSSQLTVDSSQKKCVWTRDLPPIIYLPVAHGEGKFVAKDKTVLDRLKQNGQIVFQYCDCRGQLNNGYPVNPNGSVDNIAGICDESGRILGLMPHPERHIEVFQHPRWQGVGSGDGLRIFENAVNYVKKIL